MFRFLQIRNNYMYTQIHTHTHSAYILLIEANFGLKSQGIQSTKPIVLVVSELPLTLQQHLLYVPYGLFCIVIKSFG